MYRATGQLASVHSGEHRRVRPFGWSAASSRGAAVIFFAYIGFDAVSTAAQEAKNPQRDLPIGMLGVAGHLHDALHRDVAAC